jgi:hypothetical protein
VHQVTGRLLPRLFREGREVHHIGK